MLFIGRIPHLINVSSIKFIFYLNRYGNIVIIMLKKITEKHRMDLNT